MNLKTIIQLTVYCIFTGSFVCVAVIIAEGYAKQTIDEEHWEHSEELVPINLSKKATCSTESQDICGRCYVECPSSKEPKCIPGKQIEEFGKDEKTRSPYMSRRCSILPKCYCLENVVEEKK